MSKQSLAEILAEQLDQIEELGGPERHQLAQVIGRETYDAMMSKPKTADLVDRWETASGKAKGPATKALSIAIAKVADKPDLVGRIEREIGEAFDEPSEAGSDRAPTKGEVKHHAVNQRRNGQRVAYEKPVASRGVNLALLAKGNDVSKYIKARQNSRH